MFKNRTFWCDVFNKKHIGAVHDADGGDADCAFLGSIHDKKASDQWLITLQLGNTRVKFRIDKGADETVIPDHVYNELQDANPLKEADKKLFGVGSKKMCYQLWGRSQPSFSGKIKPPHRTSMSSKACTRHYWETQR